MNDEVANWDVQLDRCLMNAAGLLSDVEPTSLEESVQLSFAWMALADSWTRRQDNELEFAKWIAGGAEMEPVE